ncbi:hypothetical protein EC501_16975 [Lysinibacillus halotolerans]|uniref:Uncharacterized protein n=1 Tax=Lysinibacillus halotolerans TaxID=1368476 RepID=A0A3M8H2F4_9BACI|nr:hypothetical protein EC501_16975 [Lysinibacillus halotolerans]
MFFQFFLLILPSIMEELFNIVRIFDTTQNGKKRSKMGVLGKNNKAEGRVEERRGKRGGA